MQQERGQSKQWILLAILSGFFYGVGNVIFGINCSQLGLFGAGFVGPSTFTVVALYRLVQACKTKQQKGQFIDYENSAYWS